MTTLRTRRTYDHRIREMICETGDTDLFPELKIPRCTIRSWLHRGIPDVVTCDPLSAEKTELLAELQELRHRVAVLGAIVGLLVAMLRVSERRVDHERLPEGNGKRALLRAIDRASREVPLGVALRIARLSSFRYHGWSRAEIRCELDDRSSCPRSKPTRLTAAEVRAVKEMVESDDHRHLSLRGLALYAQRIGRVIASPWSRLVREGDWQRPRRRVYPAKPKTGIRANAPNELWHVDVTIIRLLDGTRAHLHAVIDNFSRRILSWTLEERLGAGGTCRILLAASRHLGTRPGSRCAASQSRFRGTRRRSSPGRPPRSAPGAVAWRRCPQSPRGRRLDPDRGSRTSAPAACVSRKGCIGVVRVLAGPGKARHLQPRCLFFPAQDRGVTRPAPPRASRGFG